MSFDALALHAIRHELSERLAGGQIQQIVPLGPSRLGLGVYAARTKHFLHISAEPTAAGVHLVSRPLKRETESVTPLLLLLRKYVRDGWVEGVEQPYLERVLELRVAKRHDDGSVRRARLIIEAMGRRSNVALVDEDGAILDVLKRASSSRNPARPLLPHLRYSYPPRQERLDPLGDSTMTQLRDEALDHHSGRLADLLASRLAGFSPELAREAAWRASGDLETLAGQFRDWAGLRATLSELLAPLQTGGWQPSVAVRNGRIVAFAAYPLTHLQDADSLPQPGMSEAVEAYYEQSQADGRSHIMSSPTPNAQIAMEVRALLRLSDHRLEQLGRKRESLERSLEQASDAENLRLAGEAILANLAAIAPGQSILEWEGRSVPLEPEQSPLENAERYFHHYRKARDARAQVPDLLADVEREQAYLMELRTFLNHASDHAQLKALKAEMHDMGLLSARPGGRKSEGGKKRASAKPAPKVRRVTTPDGFEILVGMSSTANDELTFRTAEADDLWFHARGQPGAHVILRTVGRAVPESVLEQAAQLAATYSAAAPAGRVDVDCTERRHVRKLRGGRPGQVTYTGEKTLAISVDAQPREAER